MPMYLLQKCQWNAKPKDFIQPGCCIPKLWKGTPIYQKKSSCRLKRFSSWCTTDVRNETIQTNHGDKLSTNLLGKPKIHQSAKVVHFRISHGVSSEGSTFFLRLLSIFKQLHPEGGSPHYNGPQHPLTHTGLMHPRHPRHIAVPVTKA